MQAAVSAEPIMVLLNVSLGEEFELSDAAILYAQEHFAGADQQDIDPLCPLAKRPRRLNASYIQAVKELGPRASNGCAIRVFRIHPWLLPYTTIHCVDGAERLRVDESTLWRHHVKQESKQEELKAILDALELQGAWGTEDEQQQWDVEAGSWAVRNVE